MENFDPRFGFIVTRHINSPETNKYWNECYRSIRKCYSKNIIVFIDDNSDQNLVIAEQPLEYCMVIPSEFPKAGEILAYYYLYKYKLFEKAICMHDSVFIHQRLNIENIKTVKFIWYFDHTSDEPIQERELIKHFKNSAELDKFYLMKHLWWGCFGIQSVITLEFLTLLHEKYGFLDLVKIINSRSQRMCLERLFALLCNYEDPSLVRNTSIFSMVHHSVPFGLTFGGYLEMSKDRPIYKVWTGR